MKRWITWMCLLAVASFAWLAGEQLRADSSLPLPEPQADAAPDPLKGQQGWLGVMLEQVELEDAKKLGYERTLIRIQQVFEGSPAHTSGFKEGDIILGIEGTDLAEMRGLVERVKSTPPGSKVTFRRWRDGKEEDVKLLLGVRPDLYGLVRDQFLNKPFPALEVNALEGGQALDTSGFKGKVLLVDFWATWCGPCRIVIPEIASLYEQRAKDGLVVVGVTDEEAKEVNTFLGKQDKPIPYPIALDPNNVTNKVYMVNALPTIFVVDRKGTVREVFIGAGKFEEVEKLVDTLLKEK